MDFVKKVVTALCYRLEMRYIGPAFVCATMLYAVDSYFCAGLYFRALQEMAYELRNHL